MSLFDEKARAIRMTREFLCKIMLRPANGGFPRLPRELRQQARSCLKHMPAYYDIQIRDDEGKWQTLRDTPTSMVRKE